MGKEEREIKGKRALAICVLLSLSVMFGFWPAWGKFLKRLSSCLFLIGPEGFPTLRPGY
jgi:hypothetical protein